MTRKWISLALFALALALILFGTLHLISLAHSEPAITCVSVKQDQRIRELSVEAIDYAFKDQVAHLFTVWLKDPTPEPTRATRGMSNAINAYQRAHANAEHWKNSICKE